MGRTKTLSLPRFRSLDGMRGIAISLVFAFHFHVLPQGWMGVDIFFALSGYLITTIILGERRERRFWQIYWARRVARIVPALLLALGLAYACFRFPPVLWSYFLLAGANLAEMKYHVLLGEIGLPTLWSLAVEEQFYLIWPTLVRRAGKRTLMLVLAGILLAGPPARLFALTFGEPGKYATLFLTPFRLDGLAAGSLLAIAMATENSRVWIARKVGSLAPLAWFVLIAFMPLLTYEKHTSLCITLGFSIVSLASAATIAHLVLLPGSALSRTLSFKPLAFLGRISYGIYLFHMLVKASLIHLANARGYEHNKRLMILSIPLTILVSWASFALYESPISEFGKRLIRSMKEEQLVIASGVGIRTSETEVPAEP